MSYMWIHMFNQNLCILCLSRLDIFWIKFQSCVCLESEWHKKYFKRMSFLLLLYYITHKATCLDDSWNRFFFLLYVNFVIFHHLISEEIFQSDEAVWGSPDGTHIMYASFNDTNVGEMEYPWFSSTTILTASGLDNGGTFPASKTVRYPTPGTLNPEVSLWVVDLSNSTDPQRWMVKPPFSFDGQ